MAPTSNTSITPTLTGFSADAYDTDIKSLFMPQTIQAQEVHATPNRQRLSARSPSAIWLLSGFLWCFALASAFGQTQ
ncbi:MAG: hypothetical protein WCH35_07990, partial [Comamonadaceae bacterium]